MSHQLDKRAFRQIKTIQEGDSLLVMLENVNQPNAGNVIIEWSDLVTLIQNIILANNGLTNNTGTIQLGGQLVQSTTIDTDDNTFRVQSDHGMFEITSDFQGQSIDASVIKKEISPTNLILSGMVDLSSFSGDENTLFVGEIDFLGNSVTQIKVEPTIGNVSILSVEDTLIQSDNTSVTSTDTTSITSDTLEISTNGLTQVISENTTINSSNLMNGLVGSAGSVAGEHKVDYRYAPFDTEPAVVLELKNNQNFAIGFAAIDSPSRKYSNIFYGTLDVNNNITDITRVEATANWSEMMANTGVSYLRLSNDGTLLANITQFVVNGLGNYANDAAAAAGNVPINGLYRNGSAVQIRVS